MKKTIFLVIVIAAFYSCEPVEPLFEAPTKDNIMTIINKLPELSELNEENISSLTNYSIEKGVIKYQDTLTDMTTEEIKILYGKDGILLTIQDDNLFTVICNGEVISGPMNYRGKEIIGGRIELVDKYSVAYLIFNDGQIAVAIIGGNLPQFIHYD